MTQTLTQPDLAFVDDAIAKIGGKPEHLIALLQSIQEHYHYLPAEALERLADKTQIDPVVRPKREIVLPSQCKAIDEELQKSPDLIGRRFWISAAPIPPGAASL